MTARATTGPRRATRRASVVETRGLTHVALAVRDPERSLRFYRRLFGVVPVYRRREFVQAQTPGSWDVIVFERDPRRAGRAGGIRHIGFRLARAGDLQTAARAVRSAGGKVLERGEFVAGEPYLSCQDPDGYTVEIWYERPTPVDPAARRAARRPVRGHPS
ncbi:MAG: VOC family protein [Candidatus Eisenbacteria bacterium]